MFLGIFAFLISYFYFDIHFFISIDIGIIVSIVMSDSINVPFQKEKEKTFEPIFTGREK